MLTDCDSVCVAVKLSDAVTDVVGVAVGDLIDREGVGLGVKLTVNDEVCDDDGD